MSKELKATILQMAIHPANDHPIWGEMATHITIDQEPGIENKDGIILTLKQSFDAIEPGEVRLTIKELEKITAVAREMLRQFPLEDNR